MGDSNISLEGLLGPLIQGLPFVVALFLGIMLPIAIAITSTLTRRISVEVRLVMLLSSIVVGSTLSVALSGRGLYSETELYLNPMLQLNQNYSTWSIRATQIATIVTLTLALAEIFAWITGSGRLAKGAKTILFAALAYNFLSVVVSGLFGTFRDPQLRDTYFLIVLTAVAALSAGSDVEMWRKLRWVLLVPCVGSLIAIFVAPRLALLPNYNSIIPGFGQRLYGLTDHANSLGILAATCIVIELSPFVRMRPNFVFLTISLLLLILAQSKTAWVATAMCLLFVRWSWIRTNLLGNSKWQGALTTVIASLLVVAALSAAGFIAFTSDSLQYKLEQADAYTLTGRTAIWRITIEEFFRSPITGYGPSLWDTQFRLEHRLPAAGQAHNQLFQVLGQAGIVGLLGMVVYIGILLRFAIVGWGRDQGLAFVLILIIIIRCVSESPLRMAGIMGWENLLHVLTFVAVIGHTGVGSTDSVPKNPQQRSRSKRYKFVGGGHAY